MHLHVDFDQEFGHSKKLQDVFKIYFVVKVVSRQVQALRLHLLSLEFLVVTEKTEVTAEPLPAHKLRKPIAVNYRLPLLEVFNLLEKLISVTWRAIFIRYEHDGTRLFTLIEVERVHSFHLVFETLRAAEQEMSETNKSYDLTTKVRQQTHESGCLVHNLILGLALSYAKQDVTEIATTSHK